MKKLATILFLIFITISGYAQINHMTFMGIPLDGKINKFEKALKNKGVKRYSYKDKTSSDNFRYYQGVFSGEQAKIVVYYVEDSKIVYRAKAVIECSSEDDVKEKFERFKLDLSTKYYQGDLTELEQDGFPAISLRIPSEDSAFDLGYINVYVSKNLFSFYLHIDYNDFINSAPIYRKKYDDL